MSFASEKSTVVLTVSRFPGAVVRQATTGYTLHVHPQLQQVLLLISGTCCVMSEGSDCCRVGQLGTMRLLPAVTTHRPSYVAVYTCGMQ